MENLKIISGGQTGVDQLALRIAAKFGIPTGGTAPRNYMTEIGPWYVLRDYYGLEEHPRSDYPPRTEKNVIDSDATIWFGSLDSPGYRLTKRLCTFHGKGITENPTSSALRAFIIAYDVKVLNVAGNRASKLTNDQVEQYTNVLTDAFAKLLDD